MKIVYLIAFRHFKDEEYFIPKKILEEEGIGVLTASNKKGVAIGSDGAETKINLVLEELDLDDFDGLVIAGGQGALANLDNQSIYQLIQQAVMKNKLVAAICIAPVILAKAGALRGKKATTWTSDLDKSAKRILEENGAFYQDSAVIIDGNFITANGPAAAGEFGRALTSFLKSVK